VSGDHAMVQSWCIQCGPSTAVARGAVARLLRLQQVASAAWPLHWRCIRQHWCEGKIWQLQRCSSCLLRRLNLVVRYCLMLTQSVTLSQRDRCIVHLMWCPAFWETPASSTPCIRCGFVKLRVCQVGNILFVLLLQLLTTTFVLLFWQLLIW
jgi:hypothetical protein